MQGTTACDLDAIGGYLLAGGFPAVFLVYQTFFFLNVGPYGSENFKTLLLQLLVVRIKYSFCNFWCTSFGALVSELI